MADFRINVSNAGLAVGIILAGWHLCWSVLVATGWAQRVADFIFWMHFKRTVKSAKNQKLTIDSPAECRP